MKIKAKLYPLGLTRQVNRQQSGFTLVEIVLACVIFPIIVIGLSNSFDAVRKSYTIAKELNEIYAVLSACPELDRGIQFISLTNTSNCYPNNTFNAEGGSGIQYTYSPSMTVTNTSDLPAGDPLKPFPDSKVINVTVGYLHSSAPPLSLRVLITRNGIAQQWKIPKPDLLPSQSC